MRIQSIRPTAPEKRPSEPPPDGDLGPALDFLRRLWQLNHMLERTSSRMERERGITAQQRLLLRIVGHYPGIGAGQLAQVLHVDPGTVSASLKRLESKGWIVRKRDRADLRRVCVALTTKGKAIDNPTSGPVEAAIESLLASQSPRDVRATAKVLERLTDLLAAELGD